jgi:hypothetical protein
VNEPAHEIRVRVFVRHKKTCEHFGEEGHANCRCAKWLRYTRHGKQFRTPANTRSFGTAEEKAREQSLISVSAQSGRGLIFYQNTRGYNFPPLETQKNTLLSRSSATTITIGLHCITVWRARGLSEAISQGEIPWQDQAGSTGSSFPSQSSKLRAPPRKPRFAFAHSHLITRASL